MSFNLYNTLLGEPHDQRNISSFDKATTELTKPAFKHHFISYYSHLTYPLPKPHLNLTQH